jgi:hypothetical protein
MCELYVGLHGMVLRNGRIFYLVNASELPTLRNPSLQYKISITKMCTFLCIPCSWLPKWATQVAKMNLLGLGRQRSGWRGNYTALDPACRYAAFHCTTVTWMLRGHRHASWASIIHIDSLNSWLLLESRKVTSGPSHWLVELLFRLTGSQRAE